MSWRRATRAVPVTLSCLAAACGGGKSPTGPGPIDGGSNTVTLVVFYDENGNGTLDAGEAVRLGGVDVALGAASGRSERRTGRVTLSGVPDGSFTPAVQPFTLPPYYAAGRMPAVRVPATGEVAVPLTLPIGTNRPNTYLAFGDSITAGDNFPGDDSYRGMLGDMLTSELGRATVINDGVGSTKSFQGSDRIGDSLASDRPAYVLILYGTNDWNFSECKTPARLPTCFTIPNLRTIVRTAKSAGTLPVLGTIPPTNTWYNEFAPPQRNDWVSAVDVEIRALAQQEGVVLADVEQALLAAGGNDLSVLFVDHIHPNARGQEIIAGTFFNAIVHGRAGTAGLGFAPAGLDGTFDAAAPLLRAPVPPRPRGPKTRR